MYRHNLCVVSVKMGQKKMRANAVVFPQPVVKVCKILPPPRDEMDQVLAILWTGPSAPVLADFKRVPILVRHRAVYEALKWLTAHHSDYADMIISEDNLAQYPENVPPVNISHLETGIVTEPHNIAVFQNDDDDDGALEDGPCPFVVEGLLGADLAQMSIDKQKQIALQHLHSGNKVLAVGKGQNPVSTYSDHSYLPGMFPWLFPFGSGGLGNQFIKGGLSRKLHLQWLLMYHDKRFQIDEYFPFIMFNQDQISQSAIAGFLMAKRKHMRNLPQRIKTLDHNALADLIRRGEEGLFLKPETDAEKNCFDILHDLEYVSGHVQGSTTARKSLRKDIKSIMYENGAFTLFVTFSPVDFKSPSTLR